MVDHVKTLLLNPANRAGYRKVSDRASDDTLALFGVTGSCTDADVVEALLPLVLAPDLAPFRTHFDSRLTPRKERTSVYRHHYTVCCDNGSTCTSLSLSGLYERVLGEDAWWKTSAVFDDLPDADAGVMSTLHDAARSYDAPYALGAVLLACAYRRLVLQGGEA